MDFKKMVQSRHEYARAWKERTGGKVIGYFEPYFPEEIAYAAGLLPVRILAGHEPDDISDKWIYASCYPSKDIVNLFLNGTYDYVDAVVNVEGCQWMYNAYQVAVNNNPALENHYFFMPDYPDAPTSAAVEREEIKVLKEWIEGWTGKEITTEAIDEAIDLYNKNRRLLRRIYERRREQNPVLFGSEAMNVVLADQVMDKSEMNDLLEKFIEELNGREPGPDRLRLMLIGSETFNTELEELIEELGANVVIDELDNGSSYFWNEVYEQEDRLLALARRYLGRPHSAIKDNNWRRRPQHIFELAEDYHIDGAIIAKQINCHLHGTDNYAVWKILRERYIPYHYFERDNTLPLEETQLRIEAFLNMLRPGVTRVLGWHKKFEG